MQTIPDFPAFSNEPKKKRDARHKRALKEAKEAEAAKAELAAAKSSASSASAKETLPSSSSRQTSKKKGHVASAGGGGAAADAQPSSMSALALAIQSRGSQRESFLDNLASKYAPKSPKKRKTTKKDMPSEEEFLETQRRLSGGAKKK